MSPPVTTDVLILAADDDEIKDSTVRQSVRWAMHHMLNMFGSRGVATLIEVLAADHGFTHPDWRQVEAKLAYATFVS